jgi:hypothetical protein
MEQKKFEGERIMNTYKDYTTAALLMTESALDYHDPELVAEICDRAGLCEELEAADGETFESVIDKAIEILKENI